MDTFAAMALASLPPSKRVMKDKPRSRKAFILTGPISRNIIIVGGLMFVFLLGLLYIFEHYSVSNLTELFSFIPQPTGQAALTPYELALFFTIFVFLQFWNMFNARAYATGRSALHFKGCSGFVTIALLIFVGQIIIVEFGREFFSVRPLEFIDWAIIVGGTSVVLWIGEIVRLFKKA